MRRFVAAAAALFVLFVLLAVLVSPGSCCNTGVPSPVQHSDRSMFLQLNEPHYGILNSLMLLATAYGREVVWPAAGILLFVFGGRQGRIAAVTMGLLMIALIPIGTVAKEIVGRPRPAIPADDFVIAPDNSFSFPSGHALLVSAGATVLLALYRGTPRQTVISIAMTAEAGVVCLSRVYLGAHTPLDVAGGIMLGVAVALLFVSVAGKLDKVLVTPISDSFERTFGRLAK
ncbi:MAG: phosphatase PAP2 family protein [Nitrososphaera sp.]